VRKAWRMGETKRELHVDFLS
jgi:hypothetical protein